MKRTSQNGSTEGEIQIQSSSGVESVPLSVQLDEETNGHPVYEVTIQDLNIGQQQVAMNVKLPHIIRETNRDSIASNGHYEPVYDVKDFPR